MNRLRRRATLFATALVLLPAAPLPATEYTWIGGGPNSNWSATSGFPSFRSNWDTGPFLPPSDPGTALIFARPGGNATNDIDNPFVLNSITFSGPSFDLTGNAVEFVTDGANGATLSDFGAAQSISLPVIIGSPLTIVSNGGGVASALTIYGQISSASGQGLTLSATASDGTVFLSGNNTYTGGTVVNGGVLKVTSTGTLGALGTPLTVSATGSVDSTLELGSNQIVSSLSGSVAPGRTARINLNVGLLLAQTTDTTYQGQFQGSGTLSKFGPGNLTLLGTTGTIGRLDVRDPGGELILDGPANLAATATTNGTFVADGAKVTIRGGAHFSSAGGIFLFNQGSSLLVSGAGTSVTGNWIDVNGAVEAPGRMTVENGASVNDTSGLNIGDAIVTIRSGGTVAATDVLSNSGSSITIDGGNLTTGALLSQSSGGKLHLLADPTSGSALTINSTANGTYDGDIDGGGGITKSVLSVSQTLSGHLSYTGPTIVFGGTLVITGPATDGTYLVNNGGAILRFTGNTVRLNFSSIRVNAFGKALYENATVIGGFLRGAGVHSVENGASTFSGTTLMSGATLTANNTTQLNDFTSGGTINNAAGKTLDWLEGFNTGGTLNVNGTTNLTGVVSTASAINVNNGGTLNGGGSLTLVVGGGSRMTIQNGGAVNLGSATLELNDALLVNNGTISGTTNVNYGSLAMGAGTYGLVNVNLGGKFSPGNSPGKVTTGPATMGPGGNYLFEIRDAAGAPGVGIDLWQINGDLSITATNTTNGRFTVQVQSLDASNNPGLASNFDPNRDRTWTLAAASGNVIGFDPAKFAVDSTGFANATNGGAFSVVPVTGASSGLGLAYTAPQWNRSGGGSWAAAANWIGGVPTVSANFLSKATSPATVTLNGNRTVAAVQFDNAAVSYNIAQGSGGTLTLSAAGNDLALIQVVSGSHTISAPVALAQDSEFSVATGATLRISGNLSGPAFLLNKTGSGRLELASASGTVVNLFGGTTFALPSANPLDLPILGIDPSATLDLGTRDLLVHFNSLATYTARIAAARNSGPGGPGSWTGPGITTSAASPLIGLGIGQNPDGSVLVKYTYNGDATLDGVVNIDDFFAIDLARSNAVAGGWARGDFDYSGGPPTGDDYFIIDTAFLQQGGPLGGSAEPLLTAATAAVPEPGAVLLTVVTLLPRRRRQTDYC
jgi:autotransporter-associated beta strand protein